jgi:hypothetical protein
MITVEYMIVAFTDIGLNAFDIPKLRGYFAHKYPNEPLFHNHLSNGKASYQYPKIQYRIYKGHPALLGIGEGLEAVKKVIIDNHNIRIDNRNEIVNEIMIDLKKEYFGQIKDKLIYKFCSPWMALNQDNYKDYVKMTTMDQNQRLTNILRGNLLTISKAFSYTIPDFDSIKVSGDFNQVSRNFHNIPMHCFFGDFSVNFLIPGFLALGKQISRGFGVVQQRKEEE